MPATLVGMHERIEALRIRIDEVDRSADGRRAFTAAIRKEATELARVWKEKGQTLSALADALGLHKTTLRAWLEGPGSRRVRSVAVKSETKPRPATPAVHGRLVAVLPSGVRVEGLAIADVIELAGALR